MLSALLVCGLLLYFYERTRPLLVQLVEYRRPPAPAAAPVAVKPDPVPTDLYLIAAQESEPWAREQALQAMREAFDSTGDWNAVRHRFNLQEAVD